MEFISKRGGDSDYSIIEENKKLKETVFSLKKELNSMKEPPLVVCDVVKMFKEKIIVRLSNGNSFFVNVSPNLIERLNKNGCCGI